MDVREYTEVFPSALPGRAPGCVPGLGLDRGRLRQRVHVLHRAVRARAAALRPMGEILAEVQGLVGTGVVEVTLLGQNVNTYGRDLTVPGSGRSPLFARLLREVDGSTVSGGSGSPRRTRTTSPPT